MSTEIKAMNTDIVEGCIVNKRFLFWKYSEVIHDEELHSVRKFMYCSTDFIVEWKCKKCGRIRERHFVKYDELLLMGVPSEKLNQVSTTMYFPNFQHNNQTKQS